MKSLKELISNTSKRIKSNLVKGIVGLGIAGMGYFNSGCETTHQLTDAQEASLGGKALMFLGAASNEKGSELAVIGGSLLSQYGDMQQQIDVAKAGKPETNVAVINNPSNYKNNQASDSNDLSEPISKMDYSHQQKLISSLKSLDRSKLTSKQKQVVDLNLVKLNRTPEGFFMYKKWIDFNEDNMVNKEELINLNKSSYNVNDFEHLFFSFYEGSSEVYDGSFSLKIWNMNNGELIGSASQDYRSSKGAIYFGFRKERFLETGKYKAVLNMANKETFMLDFEIIK